MLDVGLTPSFISCLSSLQYSDQKVLSVSVLGNEAVKQSMAESKHEQTRAPEILEWICTKVFNDLYVSVLASQSTSSVIIQGKKHTMSDFIMKSATDIIHLQEQCTGQNLSLVGFVYAAACAPLPSHPHSTAFCEVELVFVRTSALQASLKPEPS